MLSRVFVSYFMISNGTLYTSTLLGFLGFVVVGGEMISYDLFQTTLLFGLLDHEASKNRGASPHYDASSWGKSISILWTMSKLHHVMLSPSMITV